MMSGYFKGLYRYTMKAAYDKAYAIIAATVNADSFILDCGAGTGSVFDRLAERSGIARSQYTGIEWNEHNAQIGRDRGLTIEKGDLNRKMDWEDSQFTCVCGLSVLEHLINPCRFLHEAQRVLKPGGLLVLLTPNISTYFTAVLILLGKMPSSGPHPDSVALLRNEEIFKVSSKEIQPDVEIDTPVHRHLVVFSFRVLRDYLKIIGFAQVHGTGFGLYPFPKFAQPFLGSIDPYHCHQMVFVATKPF
jgi:SAM-dependent methyltransferase